MAGDMNLPRTKKLNNRKSGAAADLKNKKRTEGEARNAAGAKVRKKLLAKVEKQVLAGEKIQ